MMRNDKENPVAEVHSCPHCFTTTHFVLTGSPDGGQGPRDMIGVNMRLFDPDALAGVEIRFPDGKAWSGEGEFGYRRTSVTIGEGFAW